jgi:hypothetical protein
MKMTQKQKTEKIKKYGREIAKLNKSLKLSTHLTDICNIVNLKGDFFSKIECVRQS